MVRRRQIEKRTDRLRQLDGDNARSVAAQCNIRMRDLVTRRCGPLCASASEPSELSHLAARQTGILHQEV